MQAGVYTRMTIRSVVELPAWVYQRYQPIWDRIALAGGWSGLYVFYSGVEPWVRAQGPADVPVFPPQWRVVLAALVFLLCLWKPVAGYAAFIVAIAYPLYLVSLYVMALVLAVLILLAPVMAIYEDRGVLFLALLVLSTPVLASLHLAPLVPLLAGLWWEGAGSWIGGGAAALWLKLCAGVTGGPVDLWQANGWTMTVGPLYERFHTANSLQTVLRVLQPLGVRLGRVPLAQGIELGAEASYPAPAGITILYNLVQAFTWAAAAYVVSAVLDRLYARRAGRTRGWVLSALSLGPGLLLIWAGYVALPYWLRIEGPGWFDPPRLPAQLLWVGLVAWGLDGLLHYLHRPLSPEDRSLAPAPSRRSLSSVENEYTGTASPESPRPFGRRGQSELRAGRSATNGASYDPLSDQAPDIMIELD
jgi:hypothetical protein